MDFSILSQINLLAVAASSLVLFFTGWFWFSGLFGSTWVAELAKHNVTIKEPATSTLICKMLLSLITNIIISLAMGYLVIKTGSMSAESGLCLGLVAAIGFAATTLGSVFSWENRSLKLFLIDFGYSAVSIILAGVILSVWR